MISQFIEHLEDTYFGNTIFDYVAMVIIFFITLAALTWLRRAYSRHFHAFALRTHSRAHEAFEKTTASIRVWFIAFFAVYVASRKLSLNPVAEKILTATLAVLMTYQLIVATQTLVDTQMANRKNEGDNGAAIKIVNFIIKTLLGATGLFWALSALGINITSLVAGLGISGVVLAFAAQNILSDLFSSLSIFLDQPFVVGDTITVGTNTGTVERIGMKTTRLRSVQGEELIIPNKDLASARIQNFKNMKERKVTFVLKLRHDTPNWKLRDVPAWIKEAMRDEPRATFDRAHFKGIGDTAFEFEILYRITPPDYATFMDIQQAINLAIVKRLEKEKVHLGEASAAQK